jgi:hypothetical protein
MTTDKARKRAVRARMEKTGERYAAARRHVMRTAPTSTAELPPRVAEPGVSEAAIVKGTGRGWDDWFRILDAWDATAKNHAEIARYVHGEHGVDGWWSQSVTVGYERARGMRAAYERPDGFSVSASKTMAVPVERLFGAVTDPAWPEEGALRPRTAQPSKSARFDWQETGTRVVFWLESKGEAKSSVAMAHEKLPDAAEAERMKRYWRERLAELKRELEASA